MAATAAAVMMAAESRIRRLGRSSRFSADSTAAASSGTTTASAGSWSVTGS